MLRPVPAFRRSDIWCVCRKAPTHAIAQKGFSGATLRYSPVSDLVGVEPAVSRKGTSHPDGANSISGAGVGGNDPINGRVGIDSHAAGRAMRPRQVAMVNKAMLDFVVMGCTRTKHARVPEPDAITHARENRRRLFLADLSWLKVQS
ncbi:hypothetical protein [Paracoccus sp. Ld10]|uniref:hypothetical protein n=1 Tax=Paracoccus sp. Ld10 TaxID=649158 RepID=UPI00386AEAB4